MFDVPTVPKHDEFPRVPSTNVHRLLKPSDHGTNYGDESSIGGNGSSDASDAPE